MTVQPFAVARRKHGQDPEADLYQLTPLLLGPFQVGTAWQREQVGLLTFPAPSATGIVAVTVFLFHCYLQ